MKKILLIVAVVLCVAVAGTALAATYRSAENVSGTLTADKYIALSLDECSTANLTLLAGDQVTYELEYSVDKSATAPTATLTIAFADTSESVNLDEVEISLFKNEACSIPVKLNGTALDDDAGTAVTQTGAGTITITDLEAGDTYYVLFYIADAAATLENIGGTMTLNLVKAA